MVVVSAARQRPLLASAIESKDVAKLRDTEIRLRDGTRASKREGAGRFALV